MVSRVLPTEIDRALKTSALLWECEWIWAGKRMRNASHTGSGSLTVDRGYNTTIAVNR